MFDGSVWPMARPLFVGKIETASVTAVAVAIKSAVLAPLAILDRDEMPSCNVMAYRHLNVKLCFQ